MQFILEVTSEVLAGSKFWLRPSQSVVVGRTCEADFSFPGDEAMSRAHFAIACDARSCTLEDLGSTNGTTVNGTRVARHMLRDGDRILAGTTSFVVHLEGVEMPSEQVRETSPAANVAVAPQPPGLGPRRQCGSWILPEAPEGWEMDVDQSLCVKDMIFPTKLVVSEGPLAEHVKLRDYLDLITKQLANSDKVAVVTGPQEVQISGADEALEIVVHFAPSGGARLTQRQLFACHAGTLGTATFLTTADQWQPRQADFDRIIQGLVFRPSQPVTADNNTKIWGLT